MLRARGRRSGARRRGTSPRGVGGYFGVFQLEFIVEGGRYQLIDFNPRLYNQLAFDMARGLPMAELAYAAALEDTDEVARLVAQANAERPGDDVVFCSRFGVTSMLAAQRLAGRVTAKEAEYWSAWRRRYRRSIDPAVSDFDVLPGVVDVAAQLYAYARHPRGFLRKVVLDESVP